LSSRSTATSSLLVDVDIGYVVKHESKNLIEQSYENVSQTVPGLVPHSTGPICKDNSVTELESHISMHGHTRPNYTQFCDVLPSYCSAITPSEPGLSDASSWLHLRKAACSSAEAVPLPLHLTRPALSTRNTYLRWKAFNTLLHLPGKMSMWTLP
jgi:hypothetical protein